MGLRSRVATMGCSQIEVSQRLERIPTIIDKLRREPGMNLGRMADIGGCRAVLRDVDEVRRVQSRYAGAAVTVRTRDYVEQPKSDGYRAVHVIVRYHGRLIEVQLRTQVQHEWAYTVESVTSRFGLDIKAGGGPRPVHDWFVAVSEAMALEEYGEPVAPELLRRVDTLRAAAPALPARSTTMTASLNHFLLVFDHSRAELVDLKNFGTDAKSAMAEYARLEREHMGKSDTIEIVLIGSDSLETVKVTHANYFDGTVAVSKYFAGI